MNWSNGTLQKGRRNIGNGDLPTESTVERVSDWAEVRFAVKKALL
jgi:hypothetical protein